jgi:predicted transcriptional regulator
MKNTNLGELEKAVMEIVWKVKKCTVRDVLSKLEKDRKIAYTTVATILHRLDEKGLVDKKTAGSGFIYSPKVSKEAYTKQIANSFLNKFIGSYGDDAIASFAESVDSLPEKKRKYFLDLLNDYAKNK